ncbi:MAG TPA: LCP family protein, partial [Aggregatilineales bacterium]|nr:LCP family protein [Aggregatilineales bacterium]
MKRIGIFLGRLILLLIAAGAIYFLVRLASSGINDLSQRSDARALYNTRQPGFAQAATAISADNTRVAVNMTNMPTLTPSPTEGIDNSGGSPDNSSTTQSNQGNAPTDVFGTPTDTPTSLAVMLTQTQSQPDNQTPVATQAPAQAQAQGAADTSTSATTGQNAPDTSTANVLPSATVPPTITKSVPVGPPPTNTKRAPQVAQADTQMPTAVPTVIATVKPTLTPSNTVAVPPTPAPSLTPLPATATIAASPTSGATLAPTVKVPTVVLYESTSSKPQITAVPTHAPRVKANNNDILNIALIGSDQDVDPSDPSFRTDSVVIVSINRTTNTVSMLSVPRDLYVYIPTLGMQRFNVAFQWGEAVKYTPGGGFGLFQQTMLYNLGIPVHFYAIVSLNGFKQIVDTLNGVDLAVDCPISDLKYTGQNDAQGTPVYAPFTMNPGYYHMNGSTTLWYSRMRHSTSDFDRNRRQQQVLRAIWRTARDQGLIQKAPELWGQLTSIVKTNMTLPDALGLLPMALAIKPGEVTGYYMQKDVETVHWRTPAGEDVQLPDPAGFFKTINNFYTPPSANRLGPQTPSVELSNGSNTQDFDKVAADQLTWQGFEVTDKGASAAAAKTVVYDLTGNANPAGLNSLLKVLNIRPGAVVSQPDPNRTVDYRVILGSDFDSCTAPG